MCVHCHFTNFKIKSTLKLYQYWFTSLPAILPHTSVLTAKLQGCLLSGTFIHTVLLFEADGKQWPQKISCSPSSAKPEPYYWFKLWPCRACTNCPRPLFSAADWMEELCQLLLYDVHNNNYYVSMHVCSKVTLSVWEREMNEIYIACWKVGGHDTVAIRKGSCL